MTTFDGRSLFRGRTLAALLAVYLVWGSTYLAIRFAIVSLPTFSMAGARYLIAGALLYGWGRLRGGKRPPYAIRLAVALRAVAHRCAKVRLARGEQCLEAPAAAEDIDRFQNLQ